MKQIKHFSFILTLCLLFAGTAAWGSNAGDYQSKATGVWSAVGTWQTYDGSTWNDATVLPDLTTAITITIQVGHTVTVDAALTLNNAALNIIVNGYLKETGVITKTAGASGVWTINGTYEFNHASASGSGLPTATWSDGSTCNITGITSATTGINASQSFYDLIFNCPSMTASLNLGWNSGTITIRRNFTVRNTGSGRLQVCGPVAGTLGSPTSVTVNIGGNLVVDGTNATSTPTGVILTSNGSSNNYTAITINIAGNVTVTGNSALATNNAYTVFAISKGSQGGTGTTVWNFSGDVSVSNATFQNSNAAGGKFVFAKAGTQTLTLSNINSAAASINWEVLSGSTLNIGSSTLTPSSGFFTLNAGAGIITSHASGLNGNLTNTGVKTLSTAANYTFNGTVAQVPGALLPATVNNLTINNTAGVTLSSPLTAATLNINAGSQLTNSGSLTATTFNILSDATNGTGTYLDNGTSNITAANVQQYLNSARNWYISSPVSNATAPSGYTYFQYDEAGNNTGFTSPANAYWESVSPGAAMEIGRGYIAQASGAGTFTFTTSPGGTLNSSDNTLSLTRHAGVTKEGFNLVGNPYPSYLNIDDLQTNADIVPSYWYRSYNGGYVFDTYNIPSAISTGLSGKQVSANIPPMQAFWLRVASGKTGASVVLKNANRSHQDNNGNVFRAPSATSTTQQILRLRVSNGINSDEAVIYANANASNGYDDYDSPKMSNETNSIPEIYTMVGSEQLVINGMNNIPLDAEFMLGFKTGEANTFSIKANEISNVAQDIRVILKDKVLNTEFDLTDGSAYSFTSNATTTNGRFGIIFRSAGAVTGIPATTNDANLLVYRNANNQITVQIKGQLNDFYSLNVYNSVGQRLSSKQATAGITILEAPQSGVYFVTVKGNGINTTNKVVIN